MENLMKDVSQHEIEDFLLREMIGELVDISEYSDDECTRLDKEMKLKNILK